jgi:threonine dehydrogenase-like Zn-dependent dehydrogenase
MRTDPDTSATLALMAVAQAAVAATESVSSDSIEIIGSGMIALQVRALLEHRGAEPARAYLERPEAIVDATGDPRVLVDATQRVADLGRVVLIGESLGRIAEMNLYPDVHMRGVTLVGVPPPLHDAAAPFAQTTPDDPLVTSCREALVGITRRTHLPATGSWYRIQG